MMKTIGVQESNGFHSLPPGCLAGHRSFPLVTGDSTTTLLPVSE